MDRVALDSRVEGVTSKVTSGALDSGRPRAILRDALSEDACRASIVEKDGVR